MNGHFGVPGIGGSLGICALCGGDFLLQILLGEKILTFTVDGVTDTLCAHKACLAKHENCDVAALPPESPLRQAWERQNPKPVAEQTGTS